jgi:hypothetical protein
MTEAGFMNASGRPVAIESDHLIALYPKSFDSRSGPLRPISAPYGRLEMEFKTDPAETIAVTVHFDVAVDLDADWLMKYRGDDWFEYAEPWNLAADGSSVMFEITDGGPMDLDNEANGRIWFSGGIGQTTIIAGPTPPPTPTPPPSSSGGGGGGATSLYLVLALFAATVLRELLSRRCRIDQPGTIHPMLPYFAPLPGALAPSCFAMFVSIPLLTPGQKARTTFPQHCTARHSNPVGP